MINPSKTGEHLSSPIERANKLNDPDFKLDGGYFNYDLTHQELSTPLFGQVTPVCHIDTVPADRIVISNNTKLIRNQIGGNLLSNINQYVDSFYVPLRNVFPTNYEKLIPNPVKGEDIPNSALPVVPLLNFLGQLYLEQNGVELGGELTNGMDVNVEDIIMADVGETPDLNETLSELNSVYTLGRLTLLATVLSRGQLLDYLGIQFDIPELSSRVSSELQKAIDDYFSALWKVFYKKYGDDIAKIGIELGSFSLSLTNGQIMPSGRYTAIHSLEDFRGWISDCFERGEMPDFSEFTNIEVIYVKNLIRILDLIFRGSVRYINNLTTEIQRVDNLSDMNSAEHFNIGKILAYQQIIAHYYTNDRVDNIYSSELFMQNLRSIMYPSTNEIIATSEPTFSMNGVRFEYDYISYGGFVGSLLTDALCDGLANRQYVWATVMLLLRRSLRYGDYFSTSRPNMLAVSDQLGINVEDGKVSPIDVTKNLLMQRYLNAANYIGQGFLQYMSSLYGVKPSDTGCVPRFISHKKVEIQNQITNNTGENQGAQTTNLVGYSDRETMDVFIDDFGYLISLVSYDVLPIYKSGIENTYHFADRFDFFNPMLQGVGDQAVRSSEMLGDPSLYDDTFGYVVRDAEYKFKLSKAHGAFCNDLPGFLISYPLYAYNEAIDDYDLNINPDFIRDKPIYLDAVLPQQTGISPAQYWHFILSVTNEVKCARKIQALPGILF